DLAVHDHGPILSLVHTQDGALWRIYNRGRQQGAEDTSIGDGEGPTGQVFDGDCAFASLLGVLRNFFLDIREALGIRVPDDRNHQATVGGDRNADVVVLVIDDVGAVHRRIDDREFLERLDGSFHEERHEAELHAVFFLKAILVTRAELLYCRQVHFVERGEQCL